MLQAVNGHGRNGRAARLLVELREARKSYPVGDGEQEVLRGISLRVDAGEFVAIVGPSGSGKTTLLNLIAGIDRPSSGEVIVGGQRVHAMTEEQLARWRGANLGIIFQFFQMLPGLSLLHNVMLPMDFARVLPPRQRRERAMLLLEEVGLADHAGKLPGMVSGGQQQRAAIARSLANDPPLIVADEPTGNVDTESAERLFALFSGLVRAGKTLLMVTHNDDLAARVTRRVEIRDGLLVADAPLAATTPREELIYERHLA